MQEAYQNNLKAYRDDRNVVVTAYIEGEAKAKAEGEAEGKAERDVEIARRMKQRGLDTSLITEMTGLTPDEIERMD
jgi:predicted transposase/invertase (TIGR01784 family)